MKKEERSQVRDRRAGEFFWLSDKTYLELIKIKGGSLIYLTVYCYLAMKSKNAEEHTWFSWAEVMKATGLKRTSIYRALLVLESKKFIAIERPDESGYHTNNYWLLK